MACKRGNGWGDIDILFLGNIPLHISELTFGVRQSKSNGYGRGRKPNRRGRGKKEYSVTMTLGYEEVRKIRAAIKAKYGVSADLTDVDPFDIVITYNAGTIISSDIIQCFEWMDDKGGGQEDDELLNYQLEGICSDILFSQPV